MTFEDLPATFAREPLGSYRIRCPSCGKAPKDKSLGVTVQPEGVVWHCYRCEARGCWKVKKAIGRPAVPPPRQHLRLAANWLALWNTLSPIHGTAQAYLEARACAIPPAGSDLR